MRCATSPARGLIHDWLIHAVSGAAATSYLVLAAAVFFDALVPLVPSEAAIVTASVLASQGHLAPALVALTALAGAIVGDSCSHWLGRTVGGRAAAALFRGEKSRRRLGWAMDGIRRRAWLVSAGRFVPGGRTATTFASGMVRMPWRRFLVCDAIGSAAWVGYAMTLGYAGGTTFAHSLWKPLAIALAVGLAVALAVEGARRFGVRWTAASRSHRGSIPGRC